MIGLLNGGSKLYSYHAPDVAQVFPLRANVGRAKGAFNVGRREWWGGGS